MTTKEWLLRGWELDREIRALETAKQKAVKKLLPSEAPLIAQYGAERVQTSRDDSFERQLKNYFSYISRIDERVDALIAVQDEILCAIEAVEDKTCRILLTERYINFKTWEQIAVDMQYSFYYVKKELHEKSLQKIKIPHTIPH